MIDARYSGAIGGAAAGAQAGSAFGPYGAAIGGVVGGLAGFFGGDDDSEKLAELQIEQIEKTAAEVRRRKLLEMNQVVGEATASIYASNLINSGSQANYRDQLETNYRREMAWDSYKTQLDVEMAKMGGEIAQQQIQYSGMASMISSVGSAASAGTFGTYSKTEGYKGPFS